MAPHDDSTPPSEQPYQFPFAASPDIIRANQKDAYFQGVMLEHLSTIVRQMKGSRFAHSYTSEVRTFADSLYLALTTLVGNRTLGEEYCDIVQVEDDTLRLPDVGVRACYIVASILAPYALNKILPGFRRRVRAKLEATVAKRERSASGSSSSNNDSKNNKSNAKTTSASATSKTQPSKLHILQSYLLEHLDTITSPAPIYAVSLAVFYFSGAYYHLSKRLLGLRYIFTHNPSTPSDQRVGYEVLGVLLVLQLSLQAYLHVHSTLSSSMSSAAPPLTANAGSAMGTSASLSSTGVEVSLDPNAYSSNNTLLFESSDTPAQDAAQQDKLARLTHTQVNIGDAPRYDLADKDTMKWLSGRQVRKCTLCLEPMKEPSATTCGHVFCWTCICDWCREKPECPLCRQHCLVQHILPLRG